ncbi:Nitrogen permease regulator-like 3 [Entomortierella beljakovae]|nr:Nitrogen permease regulator-like 3 [Entomortierella beljakovae]
MDLLPVTYNDVGIDNGLVGIIIVTNSSRGHHFVYKYPPEQQNKKYNFGYISRNQDVKNDPSGNQRDEFQLASKIFGYEPQFLANILSPKLALCDKRFQLTVDEFTFIGHPVSLMGTEFKQRRNYWKWKARQPPKQHVKRGWIAGGIAPFLDDSESDSDNYEEDSNDESSKEGKDGPIRRGSKEESDAITTSRSLAESASWRQSRLRSQTYNSNPVSPASGDSPLTGSTPQQTPSLTGQPAISSSLLHHPVSVPQTPTAGVQGYAPPIQVSQGSNTNANSNNYSANSSHPGHLQQMSFFHIVFVLKPQELQLNSVADQIYKNIACKLTAALRYEELSSQYVSQEATKILAIREDASQTDISLQIPHLAPLQRSGGYVARQPQNTVSSESPTGVSSNANHSNGQHHNTSAVSQQTLMTPMNTQYSGVGSMMEDYEIGVAYEYENFPVLLPYHTLLLLEDPEEILRDIPLDANPTLVKLVQILAPYQCLDELQYILDCSMAQIYRLASHLIYWRKAKLIDQIRVVNVYVVAPAANVNEAMVAEFSQHFPTLSLPNVLHELSTPKAYKYHIAEGRGKEPQTVYLEMLTYLLRKDLVVQLHTYVMVLVPEYIKIGCSAQDYENIMAEENTGAITPTLESPSVLGQQAGSAKSTDFPQTLLTQQQLQQQQMILHKQQAIPSQTYRYHNRSATGGTQTGPNSAGVGGMSSSLKSQMSMQFTKLTGKRQDASSILSNPGQATELEREWLGRMCENQPRSVSELFMRLIHYFDGKHHVEEIVFGEQISPKDLKTVLEAFNEFLILTWA